MVVSRGAEGSEVCERRLRGSPWAVDEAEEAKRPPPSRQTEPSLGEDTGEGSIGCWKVSAGIGVADVERDTACDVDGVGESASRARCWTWVEL